jgi:hypothetical protein
VFLLARMVNGVIEGVEAPAARAAAANRALTLALDDAAPSHGTHAPREGFGGERKVVSGADRIAERRRSRTGCPGGA